MAKRLLPILFVVVALWPVLAPAVEERRIALIIGNDAYKDLKRLDNGVNDARAMERELKALGFETTLKVNAGRKEMHAAIGAFGNKLSSGAVGLFYYAGHGIQAAEHNYLVPVDAELSSENDLDADAIDAGKVLRAMEAARNRLNIVILDACRDNPLPKGGRSGSRGLAVMSAPTGTFVAYATGPGQIAQDGDRGGNGLFTGELIKALQVPGLKIEDVFKQAASGVREKTGGKQVPWTQASIQGDFYFRPGASEAKAAASAAAAAPPPAVSSVDPSLVEMTFWQSTERANTLSAYQAYARKYPQGQFVELARAKIDELRKSQQAAVVVAPPPVAKPVPPPEPVIAKPPAPTPAGEVHTQVSLARERAAAAQRQALDAQRRGVQGGTGVQNGYGVTTWSDGRRYEGEYRNGKRHGFGVLDLGPGLRYEGEWRDDYRNGYGVHFFPSGHRHEGEYRDDKRNGYGLMVYPDGDRYEGMYRGDKRDGMGINTKASGTTFAGTWREDNFETAFPAGGR